MKPNLGQFVSIKTGKLNANASDPNGKYPFFTCSSEPMKIDNYCYDCECVLVAGNGILNVKYYSGKFNAYQRTYIMESIDTNFLDNKYIYYFMDYYIESLRRDSIGGIIKYIKLSNLQNAPVPIIDISKQKQAVSHLDSLKALIEKTSRMLSDLDNLVKSQFVEMFGTPTTNPRNFDKLSLRELCLSSLSYGSGAYSVPFDGYHRYIRITDINGDGTLSNECVSPCDVDAKYMLHDGDILFARSGATVGKTFLYRKNFGECFYAGYLICCKLNPNIALPSYVYSFTKSDFYNDWVLEKQHSCAQPNINAKEYGSLPILLPPMDLQTNFDFFLTQIDKSKYIYHRGAEI